MALLQTLNDFISQLPMLLLAITWPPMVTGAFWATVGVFALLSVFFDDETPRGNPGIDYQELARLTKPRTPPVRVGRKS
jgi:hypothetical protein